MRLAGLILLCVATAIAWDFVINYGFRSEWRIHPYGKVTLIFKLSVTMVLTISIVNSFFRDYPGRDVIRLITFSGFILAFLIQDLFLRCQLKKDSDNRERAERAEVDSPVQ